MDWYVFQASTPEEEVAICFAQRCETEAVADRRGESLFHDITSDYIAYTIWKIVQNEPFVIHPRWSWHFITSRRRPPEFVRNEYAVYAAQIERAEANNPAPGPSQSATQELLRELDLLRNEVATYRECGIVRMETLAALISDQARELGNIDAGEKARR